MLILGGASRTGKGIISRQITKLTGLPFMSIDPIKMALARSIPSYPLDTNAGSIRVSDDLWPFISTFILNCDETGVDYLIEGEVLPKHVHELHERGVQVSACFVGYKSIEVAKKVAEVRAHDGYPNDWSSELSDQELWALIEDNVTFSQYLHEECMRYGIHYVDFSEDFIGARQETEEYLIRCHQNDGVQ